MADHGESLGDHGEFTHGVFLYDSTMHIPLIVAGPGVPAGERDQSTGAFDRCHAHHRQLSWSCTR